MTGRFGQPANLVLSIVLTTFLGVYNMRTWMDCNATDRNDLVGQVQDRDDFPTFSEAACSLAAVSFLVDWNTPRADRRGRGESLSYWCIMHHDPQGHHIVVPEVFVPRVQASSRQLFFASWCVRSFFAMRTMACSISSSFADGCMYVPIHRGAGGSDRWGGALRVRTTVLKYHI